MGEERVGNRDLGGHKKKHRQASGVVGGRGTSRNLRKKEVLKTAGKRKGEVRVQKEREARPPRGPRSRGSQEREKKQLRQTLGSAREEGLQGSAASLSTAPNSEDWWPLPDLEGRE